MSERPNPLASIMAAAGAAKAKSTEPKAAAPRATANVVPQPLSDQTRQRGPRRKYEDIYRRATFFLSPEQLTAIDAAAYNMGIGKSEFVRLAIDEALIRHQSAV